MWSRFSLRAKITALTALVLICICGLLTAFSFYNLEKTVVTPFISVYKVSNSETENPNKPADSQNDVVTYGYATLYEVEVRDSQDKFMQSGLITMLVLIVTGTALSFFLTGKALKPITVLTDKITKIDENNLKTKISPDVSSPEVSRLTRSFNNMLDKLDTAFENQKRFANNAAHELKTPLTGIITNIEVMQLSDAPTVQDYQDVIDVTKENTVRLMELVQNLLMLNRARDEKSFAHLSIRAVFERVITDLQNEIDKKNITVTLDGETMIKGDGELLERAFFNLVHNAIKYNKEAGSIHIDLLKDRIVIKDTGIGIPEDCISHLCEPFYCVDRSRSRKLGGSGLGLSVAKQIFALHNLRMNIESKLSEYTAITVTPEK